MVLQQEASQRADDTIQGVLSAAVKRAEITHHWIRFEVNMHKLNSKCMGNNSVGFHRIT